MANPSRRHAFSMSQGASVAAQGLQNDSELVSSSQIQQQLDDIYDSINQLKDTMHQLNVQMDVVIHELRNKKTDVKDGIGEAVHVGGPPHNPLFSCPIYKNGVRENGPAASTKALARYLAQQRLNGESYKPTNVTHFLSIMENDADLLCYSALYFLFGVGMCAVIAGLKKGPTNKEMHAYNGNESRIVPYSGRQLATIGGGLALAPAVKYVSDALDFASKNPEILDNAIRRGKKVWQKVKDVYGEAQREKQSEAPIKPTKGPLPHKIRGRKSVAVKAKAPSNQEMHAYNGNSASRHVPTKRKQKPKNKNANKKGKSYTRESKDMMVLPSHDEYIQELVSSSTTGAYSEENYSLTPTNSQLHVFNAEIAAKFEYAKYDSFAIVFRSEYGTAVSSNNASMGQVLMCYNYDSAASTPMGESRLRLYDGHVSFFPHQNKVYHMKNTRVKYVEGGWRYTIPVVSDNTTSALPGGVSSHEYFYGFICIASVGIPSTSVGLGRVLARSKIRCKIPQIENINSGGSTIMVHAHNTANNATASTRLGTGTVMDTDSTLRNLTFGANAIGFPDKNHYILHVIWSGSSSIAAPPIITFGSNITGINLFQLDGQSKRGISTSTDAYATAAFSVDIAGETSNNDVTFTGLTSMTACAVDIVAVVMPLGIVTSLRKRMAARAERRAMATQMLELMEEQERRQLHFESGDEKEFVRIVPSSGPTNREMHAYNGNGDSKIVWEPFEHVNDSLWCEMCSVQEIDTGTDSRDSTHLSQNISHGELVELSLDSHLDLGIWFLNMHHIVFRLGDNWFAPKLGDQEESYNRILQLNGLNNVSCHLIKAFSDYDHLECIYDPKVIKPVKHAPPMDEATYDIFMQDIYESDAKVDIEKRLRIPRYVLPVVQINGNNGSFTNTDDVKEDDDLLTAPPPSEGPDYESKYSLTTNYEEEVRNYYRSLHQVVPLWCEMTDAMKNLAFANKHQMLCDCGLHKMYNSKYKRLQCIECDARDPTFRPPLMRFRQVLKNCIVCDEEGWTRAAEYICETCEIVRTYAGGKTPTPQPEEKGEKELPTWKIPKAPRKPSYDPHVDSCSEEESTMSPSETSSTSTPRSKSYHPDAMGRDEFQRELDAIKIPKERLMCYVEELKLEAVISSNNDVPPPNNPEISHSLNLCRTNISNNENRKLVPVMKCYHVAYHRYSRYPKDENGHFVYGKHFFDTPLDNQNFLTPVWLPSTVVPELELYYNRNSEIDEKVFNICKSVAAQLCRGLDVSAEKLAETVLLAPLIAWETCVLRNQLMNPYNKLPYVSSGPMLKQMSMIAHNTYPTKLYSNEIPIKCDNRKGVGIEIESQRHWNVFAPFVEKTKVLCKRAWNYFGHRKMVKKLAIKGVAIDEQQHRMLKYANPVLPRKNWNYVETFDWKDLTIIWSFKDFKLTSQLSGTHGSWTREDDVLYYKHVNMQLLPDPPQKEKSGFRYPLYDKNSHRKIDHEPMLQSSYFWNHGYQPICFSSNLHNERSTIVHRVTVATPPPDKPFLREFVTWTKSNFRELMNHKIKKIKPVTAEAYLARSNATTIMKKKWKETYDEMVAEGYVYATDISDSLAWLWSTRKLFLKKENLPYKSPAGVKPKAPRAIQGLKTLHYLVILGPWFMALQDHIKTIFDTKNWACFTSGVDAYDAANVLEEFWTIIEDDISTFDSSVDEELGEFEIWMTKKFGAALIILKLMRANNSTHGETLLGGKYWFPGGRKSGDPFTSLYNTLLNIFMHAFILHKHYGWDVATIKAKTRMLAAGDDNLMTINAPAVDFVPYMLRLGFNSEAIVRNSLHEAEFCSCRLYIVAGKWYFGPMPGKVLSKLGFLNNPPMNVSQESMLKGIATGMMRACAFIPPIRAVIARIFELTAGHEEYRSAITKFKDEFWNMHFDYTAYDSHFDNDVYASLYLTYGWTYSMQTDFETELQTLSLDSVLKTNSYVNLLFDRDTAGPRVMAA